MRKQRNLKNKQKIWTLSKKIHRWQISTWNDDRHRMSVGKYKLKQQRNNYTPIRMENIQNTVNTKCWWGCRITGILNHCWWEWKMLQPLWKAVWQVLTGLHIFLPHDVAIVSFGINSNKLKTYAHRKTCRVLFKTAKIWKQPRGLSTVEQKTKLWLFIHTVDVYKWANKLWQDM